jgi:hypothetical protein
MADTAFRQLLTDTLRDSFTTLQKTSAGERLYAFAVFTNGELDYDYLAVSANTEEGLAQRVAAWLSEHPESDPATVARELRWSTPDWAYHDFFESMGDLGLPPGEGEKRDARIYADIVTALKALDDSSLFGTGAARNRVTLLVVCGDMSPEYFQKGLRKLNPPAVVKAYLEEYSSARLYARLDQFAPEQRRQTYLELYQDLALHRDTLLSREAKQCGLVSHLSLHPVLAKLAPEIASELLAIVERHVTAKAFNLERSAEWKRDGLFTAEIRLATSAVQLLGTFDTLPETEIQRLQALLVQRLDFDADTSGPVSTLPEDIATALHELCPERFPTPQKSASTNRLLNAKAFH